MIAHSPNAALPQRYEAAVNAIAECVRIDECKAWADKAAALASYARQAKDDSLAVMARRIQARALRRAAELLKQIPRADEATRYGRDATVPPVTRTQAATNAGLSERQRKTALRVGAVPAAEFEARVESPKPPSITELASLGKQSIDRSPWGDIESQKTREACETLERFAKYCERCESSVITSAVSGAEARELRRLIDIAGGWLDRLAMGLDAD
jgi:hypothetical protein